MGSAILEATIPALDVVFEVPVNAETARHARGNITKKARPAEMDRRGFKVHVGREGHGVLIAGVPDHDAMEQAGDSDHSEIPPTPGEMLLGEFDAVYAKYHRRIYRQCFRMVRNQEDAEDLTQEVFLLLFRKAHTFRGESNFSTWLHRLTVNTVLMKLRSHRRMRESLTSLDIVPGPDHDAVENPTLASVIPAPPASTVDKIGLDIALSQLSSGYREVFLLHDAEGYRHDEIARILGISEGTSKSQLHKARYRLRQLVERGGIRRPDISPLDDGVEECEPDAQSDYAVISVAESHHSRALRHKPRAASKVRAQRAAAA